jgi:hypothetical protein
MVRFGKLDGSVFALPDTGPTFLVLSHEDVECGLWALMWLAPLILVLVAILRDLRFHHPQQPFISYYHLFSFGRLGLRWKNHDLLPFNLDHVHVHQE